MHALVWFRGTGQLNPFTNKWKDQSSHEIKKLYGSKFPKYWEQIDDADPIWQPRCFGFNIWSRQKIEENLDYMRLNPICAGLVERAEEYRCRSAGLAANG